MTSPNADLVTCDFDSRPHRRDDDDRPCRNPHPVAPTTDSVARFCEVCRHWFTGQWCGNCGWVGVMEPSPNADSGDVMVFVGGKSFHCECGANVFRCKDDIYTCNACGDQYEDELGLAHNGRSGS